MFNQYPYINENDLNLDWIIKHFKQFIDQIGSLEDWRSTHEAEYEELKKFMDDLNEGNLPPAIYNNFRQWFNENAFDLVGEMVKHVYFGLNDDGYFVVYIPEQWRDVEFRTSEYDYNTPLMTEYGHLLLLY